jgi:hypothetical protein
VETAEVLELLDRAVEDLAAAAAELSLVAAFALETALAGDARVLAEALEAEKSALAAVIDRHGTY